jgi:hypothetical protein
MSEFDRRLAELAEAAGSAVRPQSVSGVRARAGRIHARRRAVAVAALVAVGGATTFAAQAFPGLIGPAPAASSSPGSEPSGEPPGLPTPSNEVSPAESPTAEPAPSSATPSPESESPPPEVTPSASAGPVPACRTGEVDAVWSQPVTGSTHRGASLVVTNVSTHTCTVGGYPTVAAQRPGGGPLETARHTQSGYLLGVNGTPEKAIELGVGLSAKVYVEGMAVNPATGDGCGVYGLVFLTLPGDTSPLKVQAWADDVCSSIEVHPFVRVGYGGQ